MRKVRVTFYSPGTFFAEDTTMGLPTGEWDTQAAASLAKGVKERYGATPYGFQFSTVIVADPVPDGEGGTLEVLPKEVERSGMFHLNGVLKTYDELLAEGKDQDSVLLSNMSGNDYPIIVETRNSYLSTQPFKKEDFVVNDAGVIIHRGDDPELEAYRKKCRLVWKAEHEAWMKQHKATA